jgi:probable HAF family extracellular repeat protein
MPIKGQEQGESNMGHVMRGDKDARRRGLRRPAVALCVVVLVVAIVVILLKLAEPELYRAVTLPSYGGKPFQPQAMNDHGQIVGLVMTAGGGSGVALWDREHGIRELGIACNDGPLVINNLGQIAGIMMDPNGGTRVFLWDPQAGLTGLGRNGSRPFAINNRGHVVGDSGFDAGQPHAHLWERTRALQDLNPPGAWGSMAEHVNDSSQILGRFGVDGRACFWDLADPNLPDWMSLPDEGDPQYSGLNNGGYVLGEMYRPVDSPSGWPRRYAMLWHKDRDLTWLFPLDGALNAHPFHLNDANQVVYYRSCRSTLANWFPRWFSPYERHFLWDPTHGSVSLDRGLHLSKKDDFVVRDLNNEGCIVGTIWSAKGVQKRAVLLEPIPGKWPE